MVPAHPRTPFDTPVHVVRPRLPDLEGFVERLRTIWASGWLTNGGAQHHQLEAAAATDARGAVPVALQQRHHGAADRLPRAGAARRGHHHAVHVSRDAHVSELAGRDAGLLRHRSGHADASIPIGSRGADHAADHGYPGRARLRDAVRRRSARTTRGRHRLKLVYDAAHAFGVDVDGAGHRHLRRRDRISASTPPKCSTRPKAARCVPRPGACGPRRRCCELRHPQRGGGRAAGHQRQDERAAGGARACRCSTISQTSGVRACG